MMYFGTRERMTWVKTPAIDAGIGKGRWTSKGVFINGGAFARSSTTGHKRYTFSWNLAAQEEIYQILDYADGLYGDGVLYFLDPFAKATNVLPQWWAAPRIQAEDAPPLTKDTRPTLVQTGANQYGYPTQSAVYNFGPYTDFDELYVPIPPGEALHFGAHGSATGTAKILVSPEGTPTPTAEIVTNLIANPSFETNSTGWTWGATTGLTSLSNARVVGDAVAGTAFHRTQWSGLNAASSPYFIDATRAVTGGETYTGSIMVRSSRDTTVRLRLWQYSAPGVGVGSTLISDPLPLQAGVWTRIHHTATVDPAATLLRISASFDPGTIYGPTNLITNPRVATSANWQGNPAGGNHTYTLETSGGYAGPNFRRATWTTASTPGQGGGIFYGSTASNVLPVTAGQVYSGGAYMRVNRAAQNVVARVFFYTSLGGFISSAGGPITQVEPTSEWTKITIEGVVAPATAARAILGIYNDSTGRVWEVGDTLDVDAAWVVQGPTAGDYFDGTSDGAQWTGTADASTSVLPHVIDTDAALLTRGSTLYPAFDGSTATQVEYPYTRTFAWEGTAHLSPSTMTTVTDYGTPQTPELLDVTTDQLTNLKIENATGVTITGNGIGQLTLAGMIAQVRPTHEVEPVGRFISGRGHSGCRFEDAPTVTGYSAPAALDKVAATAILVETGAWE